MSSEKVCGNFVTTASGMLRYSGQYCAGYSSSLSIRRPLCARLVTIAPSVHCRSYALSGSLPAAWSSPDAGKSRFARGSLQNSRPIGPCLMRSPLVTPVQAFNVPRNRARYPCSKKTFNFLRALRLTRFVRRSKPRHPTYELHYPSFFAASPRDAVSQTTYIQCPLFPYRP